MKFSPDAAAPSAHLAALRTALNVDAAALDTQAQLRAEVWAKRSVWAARSEALPLLVGADPEDWAAKLELPGNARHEAALWQALAANLALGSDADPALPPARLRSAADALGLDMPSALGRVLDFITAVLAPSLDGQGDPEPMLQAAEDRITVLGAALSLLARTPDKCIDEAGYYDAGRVARAIFQQAVFWFPLGPPSLDEAAAATLIARWLPAVPPGTDPA